MSSPIIEVENISKQFIISHESKERYTSLRDVITNQAKKIFSFPKNIPNKNGPTREIFWALKDISFSINAGDRIGIIGRNGAGKSTLLKVLSRITQPTSGRISIRGRVASLLEVGTGFHPELTGRENIFLNGAILGMGRSEIRKKFDEIVAFAEVEKFLDTPVKRYSSGMYVRLAFAVAAHLEPEILIVDEVLAVGDAQFQKKCLGKMEDVSRNEGRTVLFVSHNMQAVNNLCRKGIYLVNGNVAMIGDIEGTIDYYLHQNESLKSLSEVKLQIEKIKTDKDFKLKKISLFQDNNEVMSNVGNGKDLQIDVHYELFNRTSGFRVFLDLCDDLGTVLFRSFHDEESGGINYLEPGDYISSVTIPANLLAPIIYDCKFLFGIHNIRMVEPLDGITLRLNVEQTGNYNKAYSGQYTAGKLCPVLPWSINHKNNNT
jgi:lipopolysaccharide transport system ATP-binding protein